MSYIEWFLCQTIIIIIPGIVADKATPAFVPMWKLEE